MKKMSFKLIALAVASSSTINMTSVSAEISPQRMADAIFAVIESDRSVYTKKVVNRLQNEEEVITADEHWEDEQALPLPAQMLRMGAEGVAEKKSILLTTPRSVFTLKRHWVVTSTLPPCIRT